MSATEQKTIFEELIDDAPAHYERRRKLAKAKLCVSREEWDEADAIYDELLAEYPDDEEAKNGKIILRRRHELVLREEQHDAERERRHQEKLREKNARKQEREEKKAREKAKKQPVQGKKSIVAIAAAAVIILLAAAAAVWGIISHNNSINALYGESRTAAAGSCLIITESLEEELSKLPWEILIDTEE